MFCSMWDFSSWPRIAPMPPALGAQSRNHWTTRKSLVIFSYWNSRINLEYICYLEYTHHIATNSLCTFDSCISSAFQFSSVHFSRSVMSDFLQPHGLQHARLPCPSLTPGADSNSCPSSQWCHPTISSSVIPFSSCFQSFLASGSFPTSHIQIMRVYSLIFFIVFLTYYLIIKDSL